MSQASSWGVPGTSPATPTQYAQRDNAAFNALLSSHSGAGSPAYSVQGTTWLKTGAALLPWYMYDGTQDVLIGNIDTSTHQFFLSLAAAADGLGIFFETRAAAEAHSGDIPSTVNTVYVQRRATGRPWSLARYKRGAVDGVEPLLIGTEYWELDFSGCEYVNPFWFDIEEDGADATTALATMVAAGVAAGNKVFDFQNKLINFQTVTLSAECRFLNINLKAISNNSQIQNLILVDDDCVITGSLEGTAISADMVSARTVTTTNVSLSTGGLANGTTHNGVTVATNDVVLVTGQTAPAENGVYVVPSSGAASRHTSYNTYNAHVGVAFKVTEGDYKNSPWICTSTSGGTLGTTAINIVFRYERGIYPNDNGVCDVRLGEFGHPLKMSNVTIAVQAQWISGSDPVGEASKPKRWNTVLDLRDIFGGPSGSGYGFLMGAAEKFFNWVQAAGVGRHVLYYAAGTSFCDSWVHAENVQDSVIAFNAYSTPLGAQEKVRNNRCWVNVKNILATSTKYVVDIATGSEDNELWLSAEGNSDCGGAVSLSGVGTTAGPHPARNKLHLSIGGHWLGRHIVYQLNAESTEIIDPSISVILDGASPEIIRIDKNGGNSATNAFEADIHGGTINGNSVASCIGVKIAAANGLVNVHGGIKLEALSSKVSDSASKRSGMRARDTLKNLSFGTVPDASVSDQSVSLGESFENMQVALGIYSQGINSADIGLKIQSTTSNSVTVRAMNFSGSDADVTAWVLVRGD